MEKCLKFLYGLENKILFYVWASAELKLIKFEQNNGWSNP
jgi:hypothetical protein